MTPDANDSTFLIRHLGRAASAEESRAFAEGFAAGVAAWEAGER